MYIYTTASADMRFHLFEEKKKGQVARIKKSVVIIGKANVATRAFITPKGMVTEVSDSDFKLLEKNKLYQKCVKSGHISSDDKKLDPEVVAKDMEEKDGGAPIVPKDLGDGKEVEDLKIHDLD